ncbi:hypothetical protein PINS_up007557 [Pythium insidiosum]|nr:hypothetical protein PINS_up007557 [Pythium insidiosum]
MNYLQSPIDPIFYTHHGFIDLLQSVYLKCQLGNETALVSVDDRAKDLRLWSACLRRNNVKYQPEDTITMRTRAFNGTWVHVRTTPENMLYPFFKDLPGRFIDYVDAKDLGVYSYTYGYTGALTNMYKNCKTSNTVAATNVLLADDEQAASYVEVAVKGTIHKILKPYFKAPNQYENRMRRWSISMFEAAKISGYTDVAAREQMETMLCVFAKECHDAVEDLSAEFREQFHVKGLPRCYALVDEIEKGQRIIGVPGWRTLTQKFFKCKSDTAFASAVALEADVFAAKQR